MKLRKSARRLVPLAAIAASGFLVAMVELDVASQTAASGSKSDAVPEYDYEPPAPGTYELPVLQAAEDGLVIGPEGKKARLHKLLSGKVTILSFIYTRCTDPKACLRATGVLGQLHELSRNDSSLGKDLQLITLSFDPGYDTPDVMERYGSVFRRGEGGAEWFFLTSRSQEELQPLLDAYGQRVEKRKKPSPLGPYQHTLRVYLIDGNKQVRNIYSYGLLDPRLVVSDARTLLMERKSLSKAQGESSNVVSGTTQH